MVLLSKAASIRSDMVPGLVSQESRVIAEASNAQNCFIQVKDALGR